MVKTDWRKLSLKRAVTRITVRLRIVLIVIAVVTALAGFVAILQARTILAAYTELNSSAQPMLTLAKRMESNLRELALLLQSLPGVTSTGSSNAEGEGLTAHAGRVIEQAERVRQNLLEMNDHDISAELVQGFERRLAATRSSVIDALNARATFLNTRDDLSKAISKILSLHNRSQRVLEEFAFDVTSQTDSLTRSSAVLNLGGNDDIHAQLGALFQSSLNISSVGFSLDTVVAEAISASDLGGNAPSDRSVLRTTEELRDIIRSLALLPETENRRVLAESIKQIRTLVVGAEGVFARQTDQFEMRRLFAQKQTEHLKLLDEISDMAAQLVDRSLFIVEGSSQELRGALQNLIWVLVIALAVSMGVIIFTNRAIIERQFNRRIKLLNDSVRAISGGKLDHPVAVTGTDELGEMAGALGIFRQNAIELRRSNVELEKFAYVAAHDLRSPLRAIHDLSCWIVEDDENSLSIESSAYLTLLQERTDRLDRLLRDLLAYARAGENDPEVETVDLAACVRDQIHYANRNGRFDISYDGPDVLIKTHLTPLQQVLSNLLSNAVRHHDRKEGRITVSAEVWPNQLTLVLADDGPGIEPQYQDRVFELFQTLQPRDEVEGSGLGLAIVKKIVEHNKGSITLFSDPENQRGTTFTIIIPLHHEPITKPPKLSRTAA